jgi:PAS domain S-box-containing protein
MLKRRESGQRGPTLFEAPAGDIQNCPGAYRRMTPTATLLGHTVPDDKQGPAGLPTDAILILSKGCATASTLADALADAGMTARLATADMVEAGVRAGGIAVVVMTGAALRSLDIDRLVAALADQPPGLEAMIIGIDTDGDDLAQRLARLDAATTLVPIEPPTATTMAIHVVRAALRARRRQRDDNAQAKGDAAATAATRQLAKRFDAGLAQRAVQLAMAQDVCTFAGDRQCDSDDRNRAVVELSDLILFTTDAVGTVTRIDDRFFAVTGFARDRAMSIGSDKAGVHPDDRERVRAAQVAARDAGTPVDYVFRSIVADGSYRWWQLRARPARSACGAILRWNGVLSDIHDRKVAEEQLRESELRHRASIALSHLITFTLDANGQLDDIDDRICELTGLSIPELLAIGPDGLCHPDDLPLLVRLRDEALETRSYDLTMRIRHAGGQYKWWRMRAAPRCNADDAIIGWFGTMDDVDLLVRARARLEASEEIHRFSVELSDQVVWSATPDGMTPSFGDGLFDRLGIARDVWMAMSRAERVHPNDLERVVAIHIKTVRNATSADYRFRLRCGDGSYRWWRARYAPLLDVDGRVLRWHGMLEDVDALALAEEKLRESEERYRFAIQMSNLVTYTVARDGRIEAMDSITANATGFAIGEIMSKGSDFAWHPDHLPVIHAARVEAAVTGRYDQTHLMDNRDGSYRWWRSRAAAYRDADGHIARWHGTLENVDELIRAEERLRESEELHRFSVELSNQVVWTGTPEGRMLSVGPNLLEKLGLTNVQWLQGQPEQRIHPDDLEAANMARRHSVTAGVPADFQCRLLHGDGRYHWWRIRAAPRRGIDGGVIRWYGTLEDVDELERAGERLRETEERYRYTVELSEQIVFTASATGKITSIGARWTQVSGQSADAVLGDGIFAFVHPDDRADVADRWARRVGDGAGADLNCRIADSHGTYRWWRIRAAQRQGAAGEVIGWYGTVEDIDAATRSELKLKQMQAEMAHMSRLNAMGAMASTMAHELNQPLAAISNYIAGSRRLLDATTGPTVHRIHDAMRSAQDCADHAGEIIRRLRKQVSRDDSQQSVVMTGPLVKDACNVALINASELGITVVVDLDPAMTSVYGDDIQFQQILINLLRNAVEAVSGRAERRIVVSTRRSGRHVAFAVDDTGPGVANAMEARLFEPFESSKPNGMGIGLSISRTIAESHGGRLEYEPSVLGGARFTILLPRSAQPKPRA